MPHIALLDLLRGMAAVSVAAAHYFAVNSPEARIPSAIATLSVEIFFVLSGFVLGSQVIFCVSSGQARNLWTFLVRRWMRTVPPYVVALFVISYSTGYLATPDFFRYVAYVQNFAAQHNLTDYYPVAWSLSVEEWFYVLFPLFLFALARIYGVCHRRFLLIAALAFIAIVVVLRIVQGLPPAWDAEVRRVAIYRVDAIAYGFVLYLLVGRIEARGHALSSRGALYPALLFAALASLGFVITLLAGNSVAIAQFLFCFIAPAFGMSAVLLFYTLQPYFSSVWFGRFCRYLGQVSYSVYLFHLIAIITIKPHLIAFSIPAQIALYLASVVSAATVMYHYFEKPILDARPEYTRSSNEAAAPERQFA